MGMFYKRGCQEKTLFGNAAKARCFFGIQPLLADVMLYAGATRWFENQREWLMGSGSGVHCEMRHGDVVFQDNSSLFAQSVDLSV
jgi:hypothetical protein